MIPALQSTKLWYVGYEALQPPILCVRVPTRCIQIAKLRTCLPEYGDLRLVSIC